MSEAVYQLHQVIKRYDQRFVLRIEHLEIHRGEIFCIVGPNGAGKSSLLRLLNFLESPNAGRVVFDGQPMNGHVPLSTRRRITTVFQRPILLNGTVQQNIAYGLKVRGAQNIKNRVYQVLEQVGMTPFADVHAKKLSGGEAQRVALARAIVIEPEVLLLDEPTANLDPHNIALIEQIVVDLNRERDMTIIMVTHNVFQAKRLAHRIALLWAGESVEVAETRQFFDCPRDPRTAAFVRGDLVC